MSDTFFGDRLDAIIAELKAIQPTGLERYLAVGRLIFDRFFEGSVHVWHDRRRGKDHSLRRLARRPGCPMSRSALHQAVSVYVASWSIDHMERYVHVGLSHVAAVLRAGPADRERLLSIAERNLWSVRRLREEIARIAPMGGARRGRPTRLPLDRAKVRLRQCTEVLLDVADALSAIPMARNDPRSPAPWPIRSARQPFLRRMGENTTRRSSQRARPPQLPQGGTPSDVVIFLSACPIPIVRRRPGTGRRIGRGIGGVFEILGIFEFMSRTS